MSKVRLADIAREAGVDTSTASRALRGDSTQRIRPEVREKIIRIARERNYSPDLVARALRTARTKSLGLVIPQIDNPVFSEAIRGAEQAARDAGYSLLISYRALDMGDPGDMGEPGALRQLSHAHRVDGLLVASLDSDQKLRGELEGIGVPCVVLNRQVAGIHHSVVLDTRTAAQIAVEHLIALGHRRIAHLAGRLGGYNANERLLGYRAALEDAAIEYDPALVEAAGYTAEGGFSAFNAIHSRTRPTAVFAASMISAAGALRALHQLQVRVPDDISIISVHDAPVAEILHPPLTTVATPTYDMGRIGVEVLVSLLDGESPAPVLPLAPNGLIVRSSTAPPRGARLTA